MTQKKKWREFKINEWGLGNGFCDFAQNDKKEAGTMRGSKQDVTRA